MTSPTEPRHRVARRLGVGVAALFAAVVVGVLAYETAHVIRDHVADKLAPIIAAAFGAALFLLIVWFLWHVLKDPTRRLAETTRDTIDYRFERSRAVDELERRAAALEEQQRIRTLAASARVHESASRAVSDASLRRELEELKGRSEEVVMRAQSVEVQRLLARYEAAYLQLSKTESMTAVEKRAVVEELRRMLAEEAPSA